MKTVAGKRVLVTGAAMGMGRLFAERAVAEGASDVVLWDVNARRARGEPANGRSGGGAPRSARTWSTSVTARPSGPRRRR